jgi:hypothetical protein
MQNSPRTALQYVAPLLFVVFLQAQPAKAQDQFTRVELGGQFSTVRESGSSGSAINYYGFGGRFDWNFNRRFAFESQIDFFPQNATQRFLTQGGQTLQAVFGLRAKVIQTRQFALFGLVRPGFFHFTDVQDYGSNLASPLITRPATYFTLNLGGGIETYASPRWIFRFDIEGNPFRIPNDSVHSGGVIVKSPGKIEDTTRISFGVAYRPGELRENENETKVPGRIEFGPLFSSMILAREGSLDGARTEPGAGAYASWRFYKVFYLDGDVLYFPRDTNSSGPHDGGQIFQGLLGIKGGIRRNHFGIFGKARPGVNSYGRALASITSEPDGSTSFGYTRSTNFVLDLGGIVEFYPGERSTLRIEAGDTHIYWGTRNLNDNGVIIPSDGGKLRHSIQFAFGYGWRF